MTKTQRGLTLVEAIVAIVITGIAAAMVSFFIRNQVGAYTDSVHRAELTDTADTALRRMARDLHLAVPNSVSVLTSGSVTYLELLQTRTGGRYRAEQDCTGGVCTGDILDFSTADNSFDVPGGFPAGLPAAGDRVVVFNTGQTGANAYSGDNTALISAVNATNITLSAAKLFPFESPGKHFQVIETPVTYVCAPATSTDGVNGTGTLKRYSGYTIRTPAASAPAGVGAVLANYVSACTITPPETLPQPSYALLTVRLKLRQNNEEATLYHETHVNNAP